MLPCLLRLLTIRISLRPSNRNVTNDLELTPQFFALNTSRKRALPASEEVMVQERTSQALRDYASDVKAVFGNDQEVDWVIVGKAHDRGTDGRFRVHWTVRGFQDGYAKFTFHVFRRRGKKARAFNNGGKNWRDVKLDVKMECYPLRQR